MPEARAPPIVDAPLPEAQSTEQTALQRVLPLLVNQEASEQLREVVFTELFQNYVRDEKFCAHADNLIGLDDKRPCDICRGGKGLLKWEFRRQAAFYWTTHGKYTEDYKNIPKALADVRKALRSFPHDVTLQARERKLYFAHNSHFKTLCTTCYRDNRPISYGLRFFWPDEQRRDRRAA